MIDRLTQRDFINLIHVQEGPCASIYLPRLKDKTLPIEYEALVRRVAHLLLADQREDQKNQILETLYNFDPGEHFLSSSKGMAIFVNKNWAGYFTSDLETPSKVVVADSFHLRPYFDEISEDFRFNILMLTGTEAHFYSCQGTSGNEVHTFLYHHGPHANSIHWRHSEGTETLQLPHLRSLRGRGKNDSQHKRKSSNKIFLKTVEAKISSEFKYKDIPLYVATSEPLLQAFKEVSGHPSTYFLKTDVAKQEFHVQTVIHQAIEHIKRILREHKETVKDQFQDPAQSKLMTDDLLKISRAAINGKIRTLFIMENFEIWGEISSKSGDFTTHDKQINSRDDDILDDIACQVIRQGGEVIVLNRKNMPTQQPAAAILVA